MIDVRETGDAQTVVITLAEIVECLRREDDTQAAASLRPVGLAFKLGAAARAGLQCMLSHTSFFGFGFSTERT